MTWYLVIILGIVVGIINSVTPDRWGGRGRLLMYSLGIVSGALIFTT